MTSDGDDDRKTATTEQSAHSVSHALFISINIMIFLVLIFFFVFADAKNINAIGWQNMNSGVAASELYASACVHGKFR